MNAFFRSYWSDILMALLCIVLILIALPIVKQHAIEHATTGQRLNALEGWSKAQIIVAPSLPCKNCGNTIFQLHNVNRNDSVTAVCCLCGASHVEIDCRNNDAIIGLDRIFKQDKRKHKLQITDGEYVPGHAYYQH